MTVHITTELINATQEDWWVCVCNNDPFGDGFATCDANGVNLEPTIGSGWDGHYRCDECGRVARQSDRRTDGMIPVLTRVDLPYGKDPS